MLSSPEAPITSTHHRNGSGKASRKCTISNALSWPLTASQRSRTCVCTRSRRADLPRSSPSRSGMETGACRRGTAPRVNSNRLGQDGQSSSNAAVVLERVTKSYGGTVAVRDISFAIRAGSVTALLGGNGAGKTTTIGMIMGLILPTAGRIGVLGIDIGRERHRVLSPHELREPLYRSAAPAHRAPEPEGLRAPVRGRRCRGTHRATRRDTLARRVPRPSGGPALGRAEDAGRARQGAGQRP